MQEKLCTASPVFCTSESRLKCTGSSHERRNVRRSL